MRILITGVSGQVGGDARLEAARRGHEAVGCDLRPEGTDAALDITDGAAVRACLRALRPDAVLHCAAWTAVDAAEAEEIALTGSAVMQRGETQTLTVAILPAAAADTETAEEAKTETAAETAAPKKPSLTKQICEQLYDLAKIQNAPLTADEMTAFVKRSNDIMMLLTK